MGTGSYTETDAKNYIVTDTDTEKEKHAFVPNFLVQYQVPVYAVPIIFGTTGNVILAIIMIYNKYICSNKSSVGFVGFLCRFVSKL
jgi:hypothetical protein